MKYLHGAVALLSRRVIESIRRTWFAMQWQSHKDITESGSTAYSCAFARLQNAMDRQPWRLQMRCWFCRRRGHFSNRGPQTAAAQRKGTNWSCWRRGPLWPAHPPHLRERHRWPMTCSGQSFWRFGFERLWRRRNTWGESDRGRCQKRLLCFHCQRWHLGIHGLGWSRWRTCIEDEKGWGGGYSGRIALSCQVQVDGDVWQVLRWHHVYVGTTPLAWRDSQGMVRHCFSMLFICDSIGFPIGNFGTQCMFS